MHMLLYGIDTNGCGEVRYVKALYVDRFDVSFMFKYANL
jgi:hypothetical protein